MLSKPLTRQLFEYHQRTVHDIITVFGHNGLRVELEPDKSVTLHRNDASVFIEVETQINARPRHLGKHRREAIIEPEATHLAKDAHLTL